MSGSTPLLGLVTLVDADSARLALNTHWNTNVNRIEQALGSGAPNYLTNPGFEIWQRGTTFSVNGSYTADRWDIALSVSTVNVVRESGGGAIDASSLYALGCAYAHGAGGSVMIRQRIEDLPQLRGRTLTFRVRVKSTVVGTVKLRVADGATQYDSGYNTTTGWETLAVTFALPAGAASLVCTVRADAATATFQIDNATLCTGSVAVPYSPLHPADDLLRCQRYYAEIGGLDANEFVGPGVCFSATSAQIPLRLPVEMVVAPTVTISAPGDWHVFDAGGAAIACTGVAAGIVTRRSLRFACTVAGGLTAGAATQMRANSTLAARLKFEANP